ncbi:MAG TPA: M23 family metallopeptidase, partial [Candidatus Competibacteraceae bacterium]|nr:M23 family metallopeptidase [Candidatus Competibacteraceae bacterium]
PGRVAAPTRPSPAMRYRPLTLLILLALVALPAAARKLYRYQDADGVWHFTDRRPAQVGPLQVETLRFEEGRRWVTVRNRGSQQTPHLYGINEYHGPVEIELTLPRSENVSSDPALPLRRVLPATSELPLARLWVTAPGRSAGYTLQYRVVPGDPGARHAPSKPYRPPFPNGHSYSITQGFHGRFSHTHAQSAYAVDLAMPEGTPVVAARGGVVMEASNDFFEGGADRAKYIEKANYIRILHDDGSMAVYGHLRGDSAQVAPGARIEEGQTIAASGNTGFTTGPHLHFAVQLNAGMELVSVPFAFEGRDGAAITPEQGMVLTAFR